jgi:hypothetical protein
MLRCPVSFDLSYFFLLSRLGSASNRPIHVSSSTASPVRSFPPALGRPGFLLRTAVVASDWPDVVASDWAHAPRIARLLLSDWAYGSETEAVNCEMIVAQTIFFFF